MKKLILINVITIVVLAVIGIIGFHFYNNATSYVTTDNAKVDGKQIKIASQHQVKLNHLMLKKGTS